MLDFFKRRWYVVIIFLAVMGFILFYFISGTATTKNGAKQTAYKVKRQDLKETLSISGTIGAEEHATLRFQSSGRLAWVGVKQGDYVKKYQGIAGLDQNELRKNLTKYLNTYVKQRLSFDQSIADNWQTQYDLSQSIREKTERTIQSAQYDLNNSVLDVELKQISVEYANLWTPIEGIVVRVDSPFAGINITPAQAEFEIINPKTIYFSATADQTDVAKLKQNQDGEIVLDAFPNVTLKGKVYMISFTPKTGETGTVYEVRLGLNENDGDYKYRFGMTGDVSFTVREIKDALYIPTKYIKTEKKQDGTLIRNYVLKKVKDDQVKTTVEIGKEIDDNTIITSGLQQGDIVYD